MKVLFLYTELAEYFISCCEELSKSAEVHIVRWPVNKEAPFLFSFPKQLKIYDRSNYSAAGLQALAVEIAPDLLVCSGWIDKEYLKVAKIFFGRIPTIMSCDTHWRGGPKQILATVISRFTLLRIFSHAWVPGNSQKKYVLKLGFRNDKIHLGFYSCNLDNYNKIYQERKRNLSEIPRRFLFVGRYYEFKGVRELWEAFIELHQELPNEWELWCLGTGSVKPREHSHIRHFGFVQPSQIGPLAMECGVFVLPSRFEPWGVVVHEYAAAGFPLVLSDAVGAAEAFLRNGENGFSFRAGDKDDLKASLKKMVELSSKDVTSMSTRSHELAQKNSPAMWAKTLQKIYDEGKKK